jgi:hypothetical protein
MTPQCSDEDLGLTKESTSKGFGGTVNRSPGGCENRGTAGIPAEGLEPGLEAPLRIVMALRFDVTPHADRSSHNPVFV